MSIKVNSFFFATNTQTSFHTSQKSTLTIATAGKSLHGANIKYKMFSVGDLVKIYNNEDGPRAVGIGIYIGEAIDHNLGVHYSRVFWQDRIWLLDEPFWTIERSRIDTISDIRYNLKNSGSAGVAQLDRASAF